jgi:hypothetical protein
MRALGRFTRNGIALVPKDRAAREAVAAIRDGGDALLEVWRPRNMAQHRAYFAMLDNVVQASGRWKSREDLEFDLMLALKKGHAHQDRNGNWHFIPDSRAVASMSKDDFERLHTDTVALLTDWLGCDPDMLRDVAA